MVTEKLLERDRKTGIYRVVFTKRNIPYILASKLEIMTIFDDSILIN